MRAVTRTEAKIPAWLISGPDWTTYRAGPLWTFSVMSLFADDDGVVKVTYNELAEFMDTWPRTVIRHMDHLREIGAVTHVRSAVATEANTYTLHFDGPASSSVGE